MIHLDQTVANDLHVAIPKASDILFPTKGGNVKRKYIYNIRIHSQYTAAQAHLATSKSRTLCVIAGRNVFT